MQVLISHPHAAHVATAFAEALEQGGALARYVTGVCVGDDQSVRGAILKRLAAARPELLNRWAAGVPARHLRALIPVELAARAVGRGAKWAGLHQPSTYDALFLAHDALTSQMPWPGDADSVYAYEDGALWTFRRAARLDLARIWDLPLPHWVTLEEMWREEARRWPGAMGTLPPFEPEWKKRRKDAELALATSASVASAFTRASLERLDVRQPIVVTPYGFPVEAFEAKTRVESDLFTVVAVGTQNLRKGTPYLLEAWRRAGLREARLRLVGSLNLTSAFLQKYLGLFEHVPHVARARLGEVYRSADLVAFPTLGDGFGLVIQEAMCCGTPVVTTRCGGGPECIDNGRNGWIIPERDIDALVERLRWAAANRDTCFRIGQAARARAELWTDHDAGRLLLQGLEAVVSRGATA